MHQSRKHLTPIFHVGQVQSIQSGPPPELTIIFSGGTTGVPNISYLDSYSPQVGDYVHAIHTGKPDVPGGADWLVIGTVAQLPGGWQVVGAAGAPVFGTNWNNYTGSNTPPVAFRLEGADVRLQGSLTGTASANTTAFTLPTGFCPTGSIYFPFASASASAFIAIEPNGNVVPSLAASTVPRLDGITFPVD